MRGLLFSFGPALLFSALLAQGQGTMLYDQQSATNRDLSGGGAPIQANQPMGQSFTPNLSSVAFVQFELEDFNRNNGLGATVYINLRANSITGTVLGSTAPVFMPDNFFAGVTNFFFSTAVTVIPGTTYYFQPVVQSGDAGWTVIDNFYNYPGGNVFFQGSPFPGRSLWFREGIIAPEPSTAWLILLGVGCFAWHRRKKRGP